MPALIDFGSTLSVSSWSSRNHAEDPKRILKDTNEQGSMIYGMPIFSVKIDL
jgi:hypothetical protein